MAQLFKRNANLIARLSLLGLVVFGGLVSFVLYEIHFTSYVTQAGKALNQPVPFSHKHHVQGLGIDCRYCHTSVEEGPYAGIPSSEICMNCHSIMWNDSPMLAPVRESYETGKRLEWNRVHNLPDFAYFDHSIHVAKGIGCVTCHGRIDEMPLTWKTKTMQMTWCLDCHRNPEKYVRPREAVFDMEWEPTEDQAVLGKRLVEEYEIHPSINCSTCHR